VAGWASSPYVENTQQFGGGSILRTSNWRARAQALVHLALCLVLSHIGILQSLWLSILVSCCRSNLGMGQLKGKQLSHSGAHKPQESRAQTIQFGFNVMDGRFEYRFSPQLYR